MKNRSKILSLTLPTDNLVSFVYFPIGNNLAQHCTVAYNSFGTDFSHEPKVLMNVLYFLVSLFRTECNRPDNVCLAQLTYPKQLSNRIGIVSFVYNMATRWPVYY